MSTLAPPGRPIGSSLGIGTRRHLPGWAPFAILVVAGAFAAAVLALAGWNLAGWLALTALAYVVITVVASRAVEGGRQATDRFVTSLVVGSFLLALIPLVSLMWTVISRGAARFDAEFFTYSMLRVVGEGGGAVHAIVGTLIVTAITTVISVPIGILTAVYLVEYGRGGLAKGITFLVDVMTGIPSIVAGLFAFALFVLLFGPDVKIGIMGSVALCVLMIPVVVRSTEEILRLVPHELREASYALGVPKWRTIVKVVLRTSVAGIATGVTLAIARVIGETAPLLVTVGTTVAMNYNPFSGRMSTLPTFSWFSYASPTVPPGPSIDRAWTAALVLVILVMVFNLLARLVSRLFSPKIR